MVSPAILKPLFATLSEDAPPRIFVVAPAATEPMTTELAVVVPMLSATAVAVSNVGVSTLVSALPVPLIQKLLVVWALTFWFWM